MINRLDLKTVLDWVPEGCSVLDLGCGDGAFLQRLCNDRHVIGVGVEIDADNLISAVQKGLDVIQEDINDGLNCFPNHRFDVVMLTHAPARADASTYSLGAYGSDWQTGYRIVS